MQKNMSAMFTRIIRWRLFWKEAMKNIILTALFMFNIIRIDAMEKSNSSSDQTTKKASQKKRNREETTTVFTERKRARNDEGDKKAQESDQSWWSKAVQEGRRRVYGLFQWGMYNQDFDNAIVEGSFRKVRDFILSGADVNQCDSHTVSALCRACAWKREDITKLLIDYGANIDTEDGAGDTPLLYAAHSGADTIVRLLISRGARIYHDNSAGMNALHIACADGHQNVVAVLLDAGINIDTTTNLNFSRRSNSETPLHIAAKNGRFTLVHYLIEKGAEVNRLTRNKESVLYLVGSAYSEDQKKRKRTIELLLSLGCDINARTRYGTTFLHEIVRRGELENVRLAFAHRVDVQARSDRGMTPLHFCLHDLHWDGEDSPYYEIVKLLIERGAQINAAESRGRTPLMYAIKEELPVIGALLIDHGAYVSIQDVYGVSPLHVAVLNKDMACIEMLLAHGSLVNVQTFASQPSDQNWCNSYLGGITALHIAVENYFNDEDKKIIELLISNGADPLIMNYSGESVLDSASEEMRHYLLTLQSVQKKEDPDSH